MKTGKNQIWNFNEKIEAENCAEGVWRKVLAYGDELMCVENHFKKGAVGALHHHPHTQITYVVSGRFEFEIDGVSEEVAKEALRLAQHKLPIRTKIVSRADQAEED